MKWAGKTNFPLIISHHDIRRFPVKPFNGHFKEHHSEEEEEEGKRKAHKQPKVLTLISGGFCLASLKNVPE